MSIGTYGTEIFHENSNSLLSPSHCTSGGEIELLRPLLPQIRDSHLPVEGQVDEAVDRHVEGDRERDRRVQLGVVRVE